MYNIFNLIIKIKTRGYNNCEDYITLKRQKKLNKYLVKGETDVGF